MTRYTAQINTFLQILAKNKKCPDNPLVLDVGCGSGKEAAYLSILMDACVCGVDINGNFDAWARSKAELEKFDGIHIPYASHAFDVVYSFHVLEHVHDLSGLLSEISRVLKPNGIAYFGTPNKSRLFGYFGMQDKSLRRKILQNIDDWKYRILHRFENRYGAHAGFREKELQFLLAKFFPAVAPVTKQYYYFKWPEKRYFFQLLRNLGLLDLFTPSVYVLCRK